MLELKRFIPEDATEQEWQALHAFQAQRHSDDALDEPPITDALAREIRTRNNPNWLSEYWQLTENQRIVAELQVHMRKPGGVDYERHANEASAWIGVIGTERRKGHGRRLMALLQNILRTAQKSNVSINARTPEGYAFLKKFKGALTYQATESKLDLLNGTWHDLRRSSDQHLKGFTVTTYVGHVPVVDLKRLIPQLNDMADLVPRGVSARPPSRYELTSMLWMYAEMAKTGNKHFMLTIEDPSAAGSNSLVGVCEAYWGTEVPQYAVHGLTAVLAPHQGKGIGKAVKLRMLEILTTNLPTVRWLTTSNEHQNSRILALNKRLGYKPKENVGCFEWRGDQLDYLSQTNKV